MVSEELQKDIIHRGEGMGGDNTSKGSNTAIKKLAIRLYCKPLESNDQHTTDALSYDLPTTDSAYDQFIFHMTYYYFTTYSWPVIFQKLFNHTTTPIIICSYSKITKSHNQTPTYFPYDHTTVSQSSKTIAYFLQNGLSFLTYGISNQ